MPYRARNPRFGSDYVADLGRIGKADPWRSLDRYTAFTPIEAVNCLKDLKAKFDTFEMVAITLSVDATTVSGWMSGRLVPSFMARRLIWMCWLWFIKGHLIHCMPEYWTWCRFSCPIIPGKFIISGEKGPIEGTKPRKRCLLPWGGRSSVTKPAETRLDPAEAHGVSPLLLWCCDVREIGIDRG